MFLREGLHCAIGLLESVLTRSGGNRTEEILHRPIVVHIEGMFHEVGIGSLGEHEDFRLH